MSLADERGSVRADRATSGRDTLPVGTWASMRERGREVLEKRRRSSRCSAAAISIMGPIMVPGRTALLVVAAAALAACQSDKALRVDFSETPRAYVAKDYRDVYDRWTRHDFVMHDVEKALEVWATFKSWDFREAYVERYAAVYSLPDAERATLRNAQRDVSAQGLRVSCDRAERELQVERSREVELALAADAAGCARPRAAAGQDHRSRSCPMPTSWSSSRPRRRFRGPTACASWPRRPATSPASRQVRSPFGSPAPSAASS